ncbi:peptidase M23 [Streptomyces sp. NPDC050844]|uniref:peptidase M23 n=1 Tax=Streptomyces sp. NPDC050844 TaxID=3155790 RepID=UPI00340EB1AB
MRILRSAGRTVALAAAVGALALAAPVTASASASASAQSAQAAAGQPGADQHAKAGKEVQVWASNVRLHVEPLVNSPSPTTFGPGKLIDFCQRQGDFVSEPGQGSSTWWSYVELPGGSDGLWISNVYLVGGEKIEGVPDC